MSKLVSAILTIFILLVSSLSGQDVSFQGSSKNVVRIGERFNLVYSVNANGSNLKWPEFESFRVLSGPHTSQNSRMQIINGKVSQSVENTYTFVLTAGEEGIFEIPPAKVTVDGDIIKSNAVKIQVVKGSANQQGQHGDNSNSEQSANIDINKDVFIRTVINKKNPYQGEQVIITYKLYFRINVSAAQFNKEPSFNGFWVKNLVKEGQNYVQYEENYKGQRYRVAELKKVALFPQRSGKIVIEAGEGQIQAQIQNKQQKRRSNDPFESFFNDSFFNRYKTVEVPLPIEPISINVKPLPVTNQPADYNGAVGNFDFNAVIDKTELKANEAINLKFTVSGNGNIELVDKINVTFPPDFEVYDPKISKNINTSPSGVSGRKTFEYLIIPRTSGTFTINPVKFSYFDVKKKQYFTHTSPEFKIEVAKGDGTGSDITYSGVNQADIKYIGTDIRHIRTKKPGLTIIGSFFFASLMFYILIASPIVLFVLFTIIWKKEFKKRSNIALMRNRKATKIARKRMKKAHQYLKENKKDNFYVEVSQALWGYLSDKFSIPLANLSMDTVNETLSRKEVSEDIIKQFIDTLNNCEYARFTPGDNTLAMENIYSESVNIVSKIESELR